MFVGTDVVGAICVALRGKSASAGGNADFV